MAARGDEGTSRQAVSFSLVGRGGSKRAARPQLFADDTEHVPRPRDEPLRSERPRAARPPQESARIIPMLAHTDWREAKKQRMGLLDRHAPELGSLASMRRTDSQDAGRPAAYTKEHAREPERAFTEPQREGLVVRSSERMAKEPVYVRDVTPEAAVAGPSPPVSPRAPDADAEAIRALLAGSQGAVSDRVISQPPEEEVLRHDVDTRPEAPTLDDYSSMPIAEFGAAMLRGMGWKDGSGVGRSRSGPIRAPDVQRRAALLGLGAKERAPPAGKRPERRDDRKYMPGMRKEPSRDDDRPERSGRDREDHRERSYRDDRRERRDDRDDRRDRRDDRGHRGDRRDDRGDRRGDRDDRGDRRDDRGDYR